MDLLVAMFGFPNHAVITYVSIQELEDQASLEQETYEGSAVCAEHLKRFLSQFISFVLIANASTSLAVHEGAAAQSPDSIEYCISD